MSSSERVRERPTIYIFELTADRHPVRDATRFHLVTMSKLGDDVSSGIAFDSRVRSQDRFFHAAFGEQRFELRKSELVRTDAIQRRQMTHQYEVGTAIAA